MKNCQIFRASLILVKNKFITVLTAFEEKLDHRANAWAGTEEQSAAEAKTISTAYLHLGSRMCDEGYVEEGIAIAQKALSMNPGNLDARCYILNKLERLNRVEDAWTALAAFENTCESLYDTCKNLYQIKAQLEYRRGNLETARAMLEKLLATEPRDAHQAKAYGTLGKILDVLGLHDAAMQAFHAYNKTISGTADGLKWINKSNDAIANLETSLSCYQNKSSFGWQNHAVHDDLASPILLVGFPRSGTTLLDNILNSHPALTTLEEKATLSGIAGKFFGSVNKLLSLNRLSDNDLAALRLLYWSNVANLLDKPIGQLTLVDKLPLNIIYLDIYTRLFPEAKIIVALRDPRDVVLSNYMQMYKLNPEMATNLNLASSARYYSKVMALYLLFRKFIPSNIHEIKYEDMVCDFEGSNKTLLSFLGLEWDRNLMQYHENAKKRYINTPSYDQVTKPIYLDAVGRWKNYESHLQEIKPILQPFVETFGYST